MKNFCIYVIEIVMKLQFVKIMILFKTYIYIFIIIISILELNPIFVICILLTRTFYLFSYLDKYKVFY